MLSGKANSAPPKGFAQQRGDAGASAQLPPRSSRPWVPRLPPLLAPVRSCTGAQLRKPYFCRSYSSCKEHHKELIMALESGGTWKHTFRAEGSGGSDHPEHHLPAPATQLLTAPQVFGSKLFCSTTPRPCAWGRAAAAWIRMGNFFKSAFAVCLELFSLYGEELLAAETHQDTRRRRTTLHISLLINLFA